MKLNIRQKLLAALAALLILTAGLQQLYYRHTLDQAANADVARFQTSVAEVQITGLKGWLDTSAAIVESARLGWALHRLRIPVPLLRKPPRGETLT